MAYNVLVFMQKRGAVLAKKSTIPYREILEAAGFTPDPWQLEILEKAETEPVIGISIPRQNGKTELALMLLMITGMRGQQGAFFGHNGDVAREAMRRASIVCQPLKEAGIVKAVRVSSVSNHIEFASGGRVSFRIRTSGAAVGLTLDRIVFDEAQKMSAQSYEDIVPVTTTSPDRSIVMMGTPPTDEDLQLGETPFIRARKQLPRTAWIEYGIGDYQPDHKPYSISQIRGVNPAWRRIPGFSQMVREQRATLSDEAFSRQRMGAWVLPDSPVYHTPELSTDEIHRVLSQRGPQNGVRLKAAVGIYPDSNSAFVVFCDGLCEEVVFECSIEGGDLTELVSWLKSRSRRYSQLVLPANARGKAVKSLLSQYGMQSKCQLSDMPMTASALGLWLRKLRDSTQKIYSNDAALKSISSFWVGYDARANAAIPAAGSPEQRAAVLGLILAVSAEKAGEAREKAMSWSF